MPDVQEIKELKRNIARPTRMPHEARQDAKRLNALVTEIEEKDKLLERLLDYQRAGFEEFHARRRAYVDRR